MVLICTSLMINDVDHLFMYLLTSWLLVILQVFANSLSKESLFSLLLF